MEEKETIKGTKPKFLNMEYNNYEKSYDVNLINRWKDGEMDVEILRGLFYGDTCTHGYAMDLIEDALFMDYWRDKHFDEEGKEVEELDFYEVDTPQEHLLMEVLDSTGDGKTSETAICVISVDQEYEYLDASFHTIACMSQGKVYATASNVSISRRMSTVSNVSTLILSVDLIQGMRIGGRSMTVKDRFITDITI